MHLLIILILLALLAYLPQIWVRRVMARYHRRAEANFPGTGGEFARHLLDRMDLEKVRVETTETGDHYDPQSQTVRLTEDKFNGRSLTAITVAAHECGHAIQHAAREPLFEWRTRLAKTTIWANRLGSFLLFSAPLIVLVTRLPSAALINLAGAFLVLGFGLAVQLITLPVETDASFNKALPLLASGYLDENQLPAAQKILRAAAWTYVAAALASLLNFWRWIALLRR
jgi:Zn-dependent membrane protease YugP